MSTLLPPKKQPTWYNPLPPLTPTPSLVLNNSLTKSKNAFAPATGTNTVSWYNCGPTVYDASHIGHARLYVTIDIMRRIMEDYFKYNVFFVMNITDIDDKIILRARQNFLFDQLKESSSSLTPKIVADVKTAWAEYVESKLTKAASVFLEDAPADPIERFEELVAIITKGGDKVAAYLKNEDEKLALYALTSKAAFDALTDAQAALAKQINSKAEVDALLDGARDVVALWVDKNNGSTVTDHKIFRDLAAYWENEFLTDMDALNVRRCSIMTRVSEYVPEIVDFTKKIIENGYAYQTEDGSVYFDTTAFHGSAVKECDMLKHAYAKLEPWSAGNINLVAEGEGSLGAKLLGKKNPSDFALWKASKPGEPYWEVDGWGKGRPGWHIECSVMASSVHGSTMDIHTGGIDLSFPHHDNELAQSEAYHGCKQWVNYFLHVGHLHIEGAKMSKSLKNFLPIREVLEKYTARQIRIRFLMAQWDSPMDWRESGMALVRSHETTLSNFFVQIRARVIENKSKGNCSTGTHQYNDAERQLTQALHDKQTAVHAALCDSMNTPRAWEEMMDLVSKANAYIGASGQNVNLSVLERIAQWLTYMCKVFGLTEGGQEIGFGSGEKGGEMDVESALMPYLQTLSKFRDEVRALSIDKKDHKEILALCDRLRDEDLVDLGVSLDDQESGRALVKLVPREELRQQREQKQKKEEERRAKKARAAALQEGKRQERLARGKTPPQMYFLEGEYQGEFSKFDEQGIPTHDREGEELSKGRKKKLAKEYEHQQKMHAEYLADLESRK